MIGDDAATEAFTAFWHKVAPLTGSKLVYSTGRTLDSFLSLASEKGAIFATPDALICAVGTKIYKPGARRRPDNRTYPRISRPPARLLRPSALTALRPQPPPSRSPLADHTVSNGWREDTAWSAQLDEGWDEAAAREAAYKALNAVGKEVAHFRRAGRRLASRRRETSGARGGARWRARPAG